MSLFYAWAYLSKNKTTLRIYFCNCFGNILFLFWFLRLNFLSFIELFSFSHSLSCEFSYFPSTVSQPISHFTGLALAIVKNNACFAMLDSLFPVSYGENKPDLNSSAIFLTLFIYFTLVVRSTWFGPSCKFSIFTAVSIWRFTKAYIFPIFYCFPWFRT